MSFKRSMWSVASLIAGAIILVNLAFPAPVRAQASLTTGAIAGYVTDPTGALIPKASVTATNLGTNVSRSATTGGNGGYTIPLLDPGQYKLTVKAAGFRTAEQGPITVIVSQTLDLSFKLELGTATQVVEVTGAAPLLQTTNPNTTSTLGTQQIETIPNPGMDLSYEANFAPGAIMNTTGGFGNVEYNGLPAVSNNFTIDGLDANDPFLNLNNSGATNLQLGLSAMQEVSVNTTSYSADQGRLGASQINFLTKSGTNNVHGTAWETWNGSKLNSADYFINSHQFLSPAPRKPRSNVNQFGGSVGGPVIHDKLFYFGDFEEIRVILPIVSNTLTPTTNYKNYVLSQLAAPSQPPCDYVFDPSGCAAGTSGFTYPSEASEIPFYQSAWNLYGSRPGTPEAMLGCPIAGDGTILPIPSPGAPTAATPDGTGCGLRSVFPQVNLTYDQFILVKVDHNVNDHNTVWYKFAREDGLQATATDSINPLFNAVSKQPQYNGEVGWTHTFGPSLVNEFTPGVVWYSAIFKPANLPKTLKAMPIVWSDAFGVNPSPFTGLGGTDYVWPQGRNVTQWQLIDNLTWTKGTHTLKFGGNLRRILVSDHDFGFFNTPIVDPCTMAEYTYGTTCLTIQTVPRSLNEPFGLVNLDLFAQDTYRVKPKLTLTYDLRGSWNSDPVDQQNLVARAAGSFYTFPHDPNRALNQDIQTGLSKVFPSTRTIFWQPRVAVAYQFRSNTAFRAGFGVFSDIFPASLADSMATNPPYSNTFLNGLFFTNAIGIAPGTPNNAYDAAFAENQTFVSGFSQGTLSCSATFPPANCLPQVGLAQTEHYVKSPYSMQWSGGIQHQFSTNMVLNVQYVGTRGVQTPYTIDPNGFETQCPGCFSPWASAPADQRLSSVTQYFSGANSNYHALQATVNKRFSHGLNFQFNYTWSHCLDTISNGGLFVFGNPGSTGSAIPGDLKRYHGPCDYDYRHGFNGFYTYDLPWHSANHFLNQVIGGWEVSGSVIYHSAQPLTIGTPTTTSTGSLNNTTGISFPNLIGGQALYAKTPIGTDCINNSQNCVTQPGNRQWLNPNAFMAVVDTTTGNCIAPNGTEGINAALCQFGNMQRNFLRGPAFGWSDLFLTKRIKLTERMSFVVSGQAYNFLNHPNFHAPGGSAGIPGNIATLTGFGNISSMASPPTGLLGSFLGGDTAPRMIALKGLLQF